MTIKDNAAGAITRKLVFISPDKDSPDKDSQDKECSLDLYNQDNTNSNTLRASAILNCYGGFESYQQALKDASYSVEVKKDANGNIFFSKEERKRHLGDFPLQIIPENSPLGKLKKAIAGETIDKEISCNGIKFTSDCTLSIGDIKQIKKDQKRVIRFAVKSEFKVAQPAPKDTSCAILTDEQIRQECFTEKEEAGKKLQNTKSGLLSSYITPLTLHLNQSGNEAGKFIGEDKKTTIYYTGFGYPIFTHEYCEEVVTKRNLEEKKAELKLIFKQQIFAVLLARKQQIEEQEISSDAKVPLVLNRPFDFMRAETHEGAEAVKNFINESLCELFRDKEVSSAMNGKIDQILIWDPEMDIYKKDGEGKKDGDSLGAVKFFGDTQKFKQALVDVGVNDIETVDMAGYDMIDVARKYQKHKSIKLAIPGMVNPIYQDGEGAILGLAATEESLNVASLGMMQILLNSQHNERLKDSEILDSNNFEAINSLSTPPLQNGNQALPLASAKATTAPPPPPPTPLNAPPPPPLNAPPPTPLNAPPPLQNNMTTPIVAGALIGVGAGLCVSALTVGIVFSAPAVITVVAATALGAGVGFLAGTIIKNAQASPFGKGISYDKF